MILAVTAKRSLGHGVKLRLAIGSIIASVLLAISWRGVGVLANWYSRTETFEWRLALWGDTLPALADFWRLGSGINTYGVVMLLYPQSDKTAHAAQAHNDYLQLAVEGGLLVGVAVLFVLAMLVRQIRRRLAEPQDSTRSWIRMGAVAGICGIAL